MLFKKTLLAVLAVMLSSTAFADYSLLQTDWVAERGDDYVVARDIPCFQVVLDQIAAKNMPVPLEKLRGGAAMIDGKSYQLCWFADQGRVGLVFDDGDVGLIPQDAFHKLKDA